MLGKHRTGPVDGRLRACAVEFISPAEFFSTLSFFTFSEQTFIIAWFFFSIRPERELCVSS